MHEYKSHGNKAETSGPAYESTHERVNNDTQKGQQTWTQVDMNVRTSAGTQSNQIQTTNSNKCVSWSYGQTAKVPTSTWSPSTNGNTWVFMIHWRNELATAGTQTNKEKELPMVTHECNDPLVKRQRCQGVRGHLGQYEEKGKITRGRFQPRPASRPILRMVQKW